jgi:DNA repair photolyase
MIVSASRRTDIPGFYSEWMIERLKSGFALVRNPFNPHQVSKVILNPEAVDCFVFWTKDPQKMLDKLNHFADYCYYFQFTITPYHGSVEPGLRNKREIIETFKKLSGKIGESRVIWRYDPILINGDYSVDHHLRAFEKMAHLLKGFTEECVISFLDYYQKISSNLRKLDARAPNEIEVRKIASHYSEVSSSEGMKLKTCSETVDLSEYGISHGSCIDGTLIDTLTNKEIDRPKDRYQRAACRCVESVDIGAYNTCLNRCLYCYASFSEKAIRKNYHSFNPKAPLLCSELQEHDEITERKK